MPDLDRLASLAGRSRQVQELPGGLTNLNLRVTLDDREVVVRKVRSDAGLLAIDREAEHANTMAAAAAGVGAGVVEHRPELGMTVLEFLQGRTLTEADFHEPGVLTRAADAVRRLHAGPRFVNEFDMFARQRWYREVVAEHGFRLPPSYDDHAAVWEDVRRVLTATAGPTVPCNNDLLAGNFIDDGERVWLIDYDYSGNNDPCFELGNTSTECEFDARSHARLGGGVLRARRPAAAGPGPAPGPVQRVRLVAVGLHPGRARARSTSTSTPGACTGSRRPRAPSPRPTSRASSTR